MINQGAIYPKNGPKMDQGQYLKYERLSKEYLVLKLDISFTNQILQNIAEQKLFESILWNKINYERNNGFKNESNYQKIPRDACRVAMLAACSQVNLQLTKGNRDPKVYYRLLLAVYEGSKLLV